MLSLGILREREREKILNHPVDLVCTECLGGEIVRKNVSSLILVLILALDLRSCYALFFFNREAKQFHTSKLDVNHLCES